MKDKETFKCDECEHTSTSKRGISIHKSKVHSTAFKCTYCKTEYATKGNLIRHIDAKHSTQMLFTKVQLLKEQELLKAKQEAELLKVENQAKDKMLKMQHENKEEVTAILKDQLEKAESRPATVITKIIKNVTTNNISLTTDSLEPITNEKLFRGVQNYSKQAALSNKLPKNTNDVIYSLYNQNPRSFIANDKSRNLITWRDGDKKDLEKDPLHGLVKSDINGLILATKLNYAITEYKNEDPFAPLIEVIENKRLTSNCEEDCMNVIQSYDVIQTFKNKDINVLGKILTSPNSLIDLAPKSIETVPHKLKESLKMLMDEFKKSFMFEPFKVIIQSPDAVGQWIRNTLDYFGNVVINEINLKIVLNKQKDTEMVSFDDLFASIRYVLKVIGSKDNETFDFDYCNDHILLKHKKYLQSKEEARENAQAFREWIQTGNFEYQDKLYNMIQKNIRV